MELLKRAAELGMDLTTLDVPQQGWVEGDTTHYDPKCNKYSHYVTPASTMVRSFLTSNPCPTCMESGRYGTSFRRDLQLIIRAVRLANVLERLEGQTLHEQTLRDLRNACNKLKRSRTSGTFAEDLLARGGEFLAELNSGPREHLREAAFSWAVSDLLGGNKHQKGIYTEPSEAFLSYYGHNERTALVMLQRAARRWRRTKRAGEDRNFVIQDAIQALQAEKVPELQDAIEEVFAHLDVHYAAHEKETREHILCIGNTRWPQDPNDPVRTVLDAYTVYASEFTRVVSAPIGVINWLVGSNYTHSYGGLAEDTDTTEIFETLLGLWDPSGDAVLRDAQKALQTARTI